LPQPDFNADSLQASIYSQKSFVEPTSPSRGLLGTLLSYLYNLIREKKTEIARLKVETTTTPSARTKKQHVKGQTPKSYRKKINVVTFDIAGACMNIHPPVIGNVLSNKAIELYTIACRLRTPWTAEDYRSMGHSDLYCHFIRKKSLQESKSARNTWRSLLYCLL